MPLAGPRRTIANFNFDAAAIYLPQDPEKRLGRNGVDEIKRHPWFRGLDWDHLMSEEAPFVPSAGKAIGTLVARLSKLPREDPAFNGLLKELVREKKTIKLRV